MRSWTSDKRREVGLCKFTFPSISAKTSQATRSDDDLVVERWYGYAE